MNINKLLFIPISLILISCNQRENIVKNTNKVEINIERDISEFSLNFQPQGAYALDSIPKHIIKGFKELRTLDKNAHEKFVTLIFTKLYAEHLECCHQSYIISNFPPKKSEYDYDALTMVNEFVFMSNYLNQEELPEIWTSGIIEKWLAENPKLLKFEPIREHEQTIKTLSEKIKNGDYWDNLKEQKDFVVLEYDQKWYWIYQNAEPTELKKTDLELIENVLRTAVKDYNLSLSEAIKERKKWFKEKYPEQNYDSSQPKLTINLDDYKKQYFPVITENGDKEVWVNLFCTTDYTNWREEIVIFYDGGNCFFNLKINLDKKTYSEFHVNGNA